MGQKIPPACGTLGEVSEVTWAGRRGGHFGITQSGQPFCPSLNVPVLYNFGEKKLQLEKLSSRLNHRPLSQITVEVQHYLSAGLYLNNILLQLGNQTVALSSSRE